MGVKLQKPFRGIKSKDCPRYVVVTGGRGSAKSFGISTIIADRVCGPGHKVLYTRYTMKSADDSILPEVLEKIELLGVSDLFNVQRNRITNLENGSEIIFRGIVTSRGNQTANLKSLQGVTTWVLDEAEELVDEETFDKIDLSVRSKSQKNQVILILNPTTVDHWIWKRWFENSREYIDIDGCKVPISTHPDVLHLHFTYLTNKKHLEPSFVANAEKLKTANPKKYAHRIIGGWQEKAEGVVFENWEIGKFDDSKGSVFGLDLGFFPDPSAMVEVSVDQKQKIIYLQECFYSTKLSVAGLAQAIEIFAPNNKLVVSDTNEVRVITDIREGNKNLNIEFAVKGRVIDDIRAMEDYKIIVTEDSYNLIRELNNYRWNDKKKSIPVDDYNHLIDATRYAFRRIIGAGSSQVKKTN